MRPPVKDSGTYQRGSSSVHATAWRKYHPPWQAEPSPSGVEDRRVVIEADATERESRGSFTLKVWGEDGTRSLILTGVTFP